MLPVFAKSAAPEAPRITRTCAGRDVSRSGAFEKGEDVTLTVRVPRTLGTAGVILRIRRDTGAPGEENEDPSPRDLPLGFCGTDTETDTYVLTLPTGELCGARPDGLFYYEFLFPRGLDTLFSDTPDNVHALYAPASARPFRLTVYAGGFRTPHVGSGIMYHVFVDRFARGEGPVRYRPDARLHPSFGGELPEYAAVRGDPISNRDFFGGNLWGVAEKLPYLAGLGVSILYLSPIFDAPSNHKYDTSDYTAVDAGFGGGEAFAELRRRAEEYGMRIVLDGVFNHTGSDSVYFDAEAKHGLPAADPRSPYHGWYRFDASYKHGYECWWDIDILPRMRTDNPGCEAFFTAPDGIGARYASLGCGWRLDVADELPDAFLEHLRASVKAKNPDALLIGEVWENASDKVAYGRRRSYFRGRQLDSVMNYPLRTALLRFGAYGDAQGLADTLTELYADYPRCVCDCLMNIIGTHDTFRALSYLGDPGGTEVLAEEQHNAVLAAARLTPEQYRRGIAALKAVSAVQYTVYGFPCVFYGDEAGMEGLGDPFCRKPMPWDSPDAALTEHYRRLGSLRRACPAFDGGEFRVLNADGGLLVYERRRGRTRVTVAVNCGGGERSVVLRGTDLYSGAVCDGAEAIAPFGFRIVRS